ncbi:Aspartate racemase [Latilactobacillus fuchuensis]|uniref:Aspartate racemase n=2 Tax=Latilactobacillus fuchuensis TaxID=164393 RepID=A0A2N9DYD0_9LACO|nr:Aspartate racemase [Latilactobacillus fuchuensis]
MMKQFFTVLGGMGTAATESYIRLLNQRTPSKRDQDFLDYIVVNHATIPDRSTYLMDHTQPNPAPYLLEDIQQQSLLKPAFFVIACNTAHYFYDELQAAASAPIVHMPRETVKSIQTTYPTARRIGILGTKGTVTDGIYDQELAAVGYEIVKPSEDLQERTMDLIFNDIKGQAKMNGAKYHAILETMITEGHCDAVILGCTELSLAQEWAPDHAFPVVDSQSVLVDRSIELALKLREK